MCGRANPYSFGIKHVTSGKVPDTVCDPIWGYNTYCICLVITAL